MKKKMGMHKMGQASDLPSMGFMNPTVTRKNLRGMGKAFMKGFMGSMRMGFGMMNGLIPEAVRRRGSACLGLKGVARGRCLAKKMGGCLGLMGQELKSCKAHRRKLRKSILGGAWVLVKKNNGQCECTQKPSGQIVVGRYHSFKECETHRSHDC